MVLSTESPAALHAPHTSGRTSTNLLLLGQESKVHALQAVDIGGHVYVDAQDGDVVGASRTCAGDSGRRQKITPYDTLYTDARERTPYATRVAMGYPVFFPADGANTTFRCQGVKRVDQRWMQEKTLEIEQNALRNGLRFADPVSRFQAMSSAARVVHGSLDSRTLGRSTPLLKATSP